MTQDPYGRPPGTGYVVPGEVVPDDEASETSPMTHFQKVASALRGDRADPAAPEQGPSDQADAGASPPDTQAPDTQAPDTQAPDAQAPDAQAPDAQAPDAQAPDTQAPDTQAPDPNGTWPRANQATATDAQDSTDVQDSLDAQDFAGAQDSLDDEADHDATRPQEVVAVRSPDDESRDYWRRDGARRRRPRQRPRTRRIPP